MGDGGAFSPLQIEEVICRLSLTQQEPAAMKQWNFVQFGVLIQLFPIGSHAALAEETTRLAV
jgi:hypothetical protein